MQTSGTIYFPSNPSIQNTSNIGGPFEANSNMATIFDYLYDDVWANANSFESAQQLMIEKACSLLLDKEKLSFQDVDYFISGDLTNQITPTTFAAYKTTLPYIGLFSACATIVESLLISSMLIELKQANQIICGSSSHHAAAERQFRYPTEYGGQKPPTAQWTVTGAGFALISNDIKSPIKIVNGTFGKVIDYEETDPFHMGAAMAPAAVDTIIRHFQATNTTAKDYDYIVTGDLGSIGHQIAYELLLQNDVSIDQNKFLDCGILFYNEKQPVHAGGSGAACAAIVSLGHFYRLLSEGKIKSILLVATGALHSPLTVQQKMNIPSIAHAITIQNKGVDA